MMRRCLAVAVVVLLSAGASRAGAQLFQIKVVDSQTGRGVPLVELQPLGWAKLITDSNGIVAIEDLALLRKPSPSGFPS